MKCQTKKDKYGMILIRCKIKKNNKIMNIKKKKHPHRYREETSGYQWGKGRGRGNMG